MQSMILPQYRAHNAVHCLRCSRSAIRMLWLWAVQDCSSVPNSTSRFGNLRFQIKAGGWSCKIYSCSHSCIDLSPGRHLLRLGATCKGREHPCASRSDADGGVYVHLFVSTDSFKFVWVERVRAGMQMMPARLQQRQAQACRMPSGHAAAGSVARGELLTNSLEQLA
jgi:hypothetical protein